MPSILARAKKFTKAAVTLSTTEKRLGNLRKGRKAVPVKKCAKKQARYCKQYRRDTRCTMEELRAKLLEENIIMYMAEQAWNELKEAEQRQYTYTCWKAAGKPTPGSKLESDLVLDLVLRHDMDPTYEATLLRHFNHFHENRDTADFDPSKRRSGGGRKRMMDESESKMNAELRANGTGARISCMSVNTLRAVKHKAQNLPGNPVMVSESTARRDFKFRYGGELHTASCEAQEIAVTRKLG